MPTFDNCTYPQVVFCNFQHNSNKKMYLLYLYNFIQDLTIQIDPHSTGQLFSDISDHLYLSSRSLFLFITSIHFRLFIPPSTKEFFFEFFNHFWDIVLPKTPKKQIRKFFFFFNRKYPFQVWTKTSRWYLQGYGSTTFLLLRILT